MGCVKDLGQFLGSCWSGRGVVPADSGPGLRTGEGWLYPAMVIDLATRMVVGWQTADHMRTSLVTDTLAAAIDQSVVRKWVPLPVTVAVGVVGVGGAAAADVGRDAETDTYDGHNNLTKDPATSAVGLRSGAAVTPTGRSLVATGRQASPVLPEQSCAGQLNSSRRGRCGRCVPVDLRQCSQPA